MVVVVIMGLAMAAAVPSMLQSMRDRRLQQSAIDFINVFKLARSTAMMRGNAHLIQVTGGMAPSVVRMIEGDSNSCRLSNFAGPTTRVLFEDLQPPTTTFNMLNVVPNSNYVEFCYTPSGRMYYRFAPAGLFLDDNSGFNGVALNGGFVYRFVSTEAAATVARIVFIPTGGIPRLRP
jgi:Tfp pilus assembly protein FimT